MKPGDDVVYVRCTCEPVCARAQLCGILLFGTMEFRAVVAGERLLCRLDSGEFETFEAGAVETLDAVAHRAVLEAVEG